MNATEALGSTLDATKNDVRETAAALDNAILNDRTLSHETRLVLIGLQTAVRRQNLMLETLAIVIDAQDARLSYIMDYLKQNK